MKKAPHMLYYFKIKLLMKLLLYKTRPVYFLFVYMVFC